MTVMDKRLKRHRLLAVLALVSLSLPALGQSPEHYHSITAEDLYGGIMEGKLASWVQDPAQRTMLSTLMATSYILGVADSARGKQWCPAKDLSVQTLSGTVLDYLADLPRSRNTENAAAIVTEALAKSQPCP